LELEGCRTSGGFAGGFRGEAGSAAAAAAVVSRLGCDAGGSAAMMLTCGIDADDGK
jgi:hypothetical protein